MGSSVRSNFSMTGMRYDNVFPEPVTASTTTSLLPIARGIVLACTGVILANPKLETAVMIQSESAGVRASQAREVAIFGLSIVLGMLCLSFV